MPSIYEVDLEKNAANHAPLTPLTFLRWSAEVYPERLSVVHGARRYRWRETDLRARRLASALRRRGVGRGDTVSALLANTPEMYEAHFGVPSTGAVLNAINTRLDADTIGYILAHCEAKVVLCDREYAPVLGAALAQLPRRPLVIDVVDSEYLGEGSPIGDCEYEQLLAEGDESEPPCLPRDEWDAMALNYTSGTTGRPKGVVYSHRASMLTALDNAMVWDLPRHPVYLWTLPMFHCNGWCFTWAVAAKAGTNVCLRKVEARAVLQAMREHGVTHYCGAPIVHSKLLEAATQAGVRFERPIAALIGGAPPPAVLAQGMERIGIELTHIYGLTEVCGPASICAKHEDWDALSPSERAELNVRQGVRCILQEEITVLDRRTMQAVPRDGQTIGEVMFRGNLMMKGYLKDREASEEAFRGGYLHTGDCAVVEPDGYVRLKDRAKDIIISGGENISSIEVEDALHHHPAVLVTAVVAQPDPTWGESPCAFVELREGEKVSEQELITHCRARLAHFKVPKRVVFGAVPRTSTGKIQKYLLRKQVREGASAH